MTEIKSRGLYVHVPFCKRKCNYCDFCSSAASHQTVEAYVDMLCCEIDSYAAADMPQHVDTVFFGGGTPSLLSASQMSQIIAHIRSAFVISPDAEITVEINPGTVTQEKMQAYFDLGINRISIGLQSIHENEMKILGRIHTYEDFLEAYSMLRHIGFSNISVDIMYGIPCQTMASLEQTLNAVIALQPEHISAYGLIIEEGTPFFEMRSELDLPSEDDEADMYALITDVLARSGFCHYEISNYARPGFACRHNLKYWHDEEYFAVGLAAHSYVEGKRYAATEKMDEYLDGYGTKYKRTISDSGLDAFEYAMLALRLAEGLDLEKYRNLFGVDLLRSRHIEIGEAERGGYLTVSNGRLALTEKGFYVSNYIISSLL